MRRIALLFTFLLVLTGTVSEAVAQQPKWIGTKGDWSVYTFAEGGKLVCYMASAPVKAVGNYKRRGQIFALVTNRPAAKSKNVVSLVAGYTYEKGSEAIAKVGKDEFKLFTDTDRAWSPNPKTDRALVAAMVKGRRMEVRGQSSRGTKTNDTYSLNGFTAAKKLIDKTCKI
jgi:hypothetical protein